MSSVPDIIALFFAYCCVRAMFRAMFWDYL